MGGKRRVVIALAAIALGDDVGGWSLGGDGRRLDYLDESARHELIVV